MSTPVRPPPMTTAGRRACRLDSESALKAPVNCSAIRKSLALRMPRSRLFLMSMMVGRPAPAAMATWSIAAGPGLVERQRAAEADAAVDAEARPPRQGEVDERQEVLVPAHGDAVLGDAAEAFEHARVERPVDVAPVARSAAAAARLSPASTGSGGSIFSPSMATTPKPSFSEVMRERVAGRAEADDQDVPAVVRQGMRPLAIERDSSA